MPFLSEHGVVTSTDAERAAEAAEALADRLTDTALSVTRQRNDDFDWRPTAAQADALITALNLGAAEARSIAVLARRDCRHD